MADDAAFGPFVAETTVADDHPMGIDPRLSADDKGEPAPVWAASQRLREVVERQEPLPPAVDRLLLVTEIQRQLVTLGLYREVTRVLTGPLDPRSAVGLYAILFPGEGRDNTGIKDLNDKVLGYHLTSQFIVARQDEIKAIFPPPGDKPGPGFFTVGQDYKTASIVAIGKQPEEFVKDLVRLDARLRARLLEFLKKAEQDPDAASRRKAISDLQRALRDEHYRYDFLFGANSVPARGQAVDIVFRLLTETLKGAGSARFAAKVKSLRKWYVQRLAKGRAEPPQQGHDPRGREFHTANFLRALQTADDIKKLAAAGPHRDQPLDFYAIFVNKVWTATFLPYYARFFGNPDMVRDVRKRLLERPTIWEGLKYDYEVQRELLELWLVALNMIDFVKDFVSAEYPHAVRTHHTEGLIRLVQLLNPAEIIEWSRLTRFLTRDIRQTSPDPFIVQGTASEYLFYSHAADQPNQLFFTMDIRDLGVELMAYYEAAQMAIQDKLTGINLMQATLRSTDVIVARKRFTYDSVVAVFKKHHPAASQAALEATQAFGTLLSTGTMPEFRDSIRVMLGGDEVFVAAHPYYAGVAHLIVADLSRIKFQDRPLNMRTGVAFSTADLARANGRPLSGPFISDEQRKANQRAHNKAVQLAADSHGLVKPLERIHRRIELLIEKLENNPKKKDLAPHHRKRLADLRLLDLWVCVQRGTSKSLPPVTYARLRRLLAGGDIVGAVGTTLVELVDLAGKVVDARKVKQLAAELEAAVVRDVGRDNYHIDGPPVTKMPKWIEKLLDGLLDPSDPEEEKKKKKKQQQLDEPIPA